MAKKPLQRMRYEKLWGNEWSDLQIELECYVMNHSPDEGGLGAAGHLKKAMQLLWPSIYAGEQEPGIPRWRPEIERMVWAWCNYSIIIVLGHASAAKTHTFSHIGVASFLADPFETILTLTSTHLPGLRKRIWSDVKAAASSSTLGEVFSFRNFDLTARPIVTAKEDKYIIEGIATDKGQDAVSKIQGNHSKNHRFVIIDEADGTPGAIFDASANLMSDADFRMVALANPAKQYNELGMWAEPKNGWSSVDPELDFEWETKKGGICLRLDGLQSPNIKYQRTVFPWLIDQKYVDMIKDTHGMNSPRYWTFVRAWYPPDGAMGTIMSPAILARADNKLDFQYKPTPVASLDPSFEGGDDRILTIGEYGPIGDMPFNLNILEQIPIKVTMTKESDPLDFLIAREVQRICEDRGVAPSDFAMDSTGNGRGVLAILQREWSTEIHSVSFGGPVTERPIRYGDPTPAKELYDRFVTELWFATREFILDGRVGGLAGRTKLKDQLAAREYEMISERKSKVETKKDYSKRLGYSPDYADSLVVMIELLRRKGAVAGTEDDFRGSRRSTRSAQMDVAKKYSALEVAAMRGLD
jgi:hypothetical protein